jgi:rubrerythrin
MKTLFAAILFCSLSFGAFAQQTAATKTTTTTKVADSYRCPVCGYTGTKAGDCPKDKTALVKVGDYYCPDCYMTSKKAEKCPMCGVDMKKMMPATASVPKK